MEHSTPGIIVLIFIFIGPLFFYISRVSRGHVYELRKIKGIEEIDNAIGRAVEEGRGVSFSTGMTDVSPLLFACLGVLNFVAEKCAQLKAKLIIPARDPESLALIDATLQQAYQRKGKLSQYDPSQIRYLSSEQLAYASGYQGVIHRENIGAAFLFGSFAAESLILAEAGQQVGATQVAGTISNEQIPFFISSCDYTLLGEELYAASAYLTKDPTQLASIRAQDIAKLSLLICICAGVIIASLNTCGYEIKSESIRELVEKPWSAIN
jgi:hypothetical protein